MRHRIKGRKLGRTPAHRKALFRNMACSLIRSLRYEEDALNKPKVPGRIVTTVQKAKELRPFIEKLVTMAREALVYESEAVQYEAPGPRGSSTWREWRESEQWNRWNQAIAPAVALRRRAFALLRGSEAVDILFDELANRFRDRNGGYTRIVRLPKRRLGDAGQLAFIEFVGERDRTKKKRLAPTVAEEELSEPEAAERTEPEAEEGADDEQAARTPAEEQPASVDVAETAAADQQAEAEGEAPAAEGKASAETGTDVEGPSPKEDATEAATAEQTGPDQREPAEPSGQAEAPESEAADAEEPQEEPQTEADAAGEDKTKKSGFRRWFGR